RSTLLHAFSEEEYSNTTPEKTIPVFPQSCRSCDGAYLPSRLHSGGSIKQHRPASPLPTTTAPHYQHFSSASPRLVLASSGLSV
uniref:Uncharacterized protein n=1 Tax=Aegilops tauschii subsp. strangulata TaxID=200361 RepID=A0A453MIE9_AEGTS